MKATNKERSKIIGGKKKGRHSIEDEKNSGNAPLPARHKI
jgi:hypothetical protein